jgi:hypothetical protein
MLVTKRSSPIRIIFSHNLFVISFRQAKSSSAIPSSIEIIGYLLVQDSYKSTRSDSFKVLPSPARTYFQSLKNSEAAQSRANFIFHSCQACCIAWIITCNASSFDHKFGAYHHSSPTDVENHLALRIFFKL